LIWIVKQNAFPATAVLGRLPGTKVFRDIRLFTDTQEVSGCKILRFDASINFSNTLYFEKLVHQLFKIDEVITPYSKKLTKGHTLKACDSLLASVSSLSYSPLNL
jgi:MFS superfamily sulfate permease-like transporter